MVERGEVDGLPRPDRHQMTGVDAVDVLEIGMGPDPLADRGGEHRGIRRRRGTDGLAVRLEDDGKAVDPGHSVEHAAQILQVEIDREDAFGRRVIGGPPGAAGRDALDAVEEHVRLAPHRRVDFQRVDEPTALPRVVVGRAGTLIGNFLPFDGDRVLMRRPLAWHRDAAHDRAVVVAPDADEAAGLQVAVADPGERGIDPEPLREIEAECAVVIELEHAAARTDAILVEEAVGGIVEEIGHLVSGDGIGQCEFLLGEMLDRAMAVGVAEITDEPGRDQEQTTQNQRQQRAQRHAVLLRERTAEIDPN